MTISMSPTYVLLFLPLLVAFSIVYAATRHERQDLIVKQAWSTAVWVTGFMGIIFAVLWIVSNIV